MAYWLMKSEPSAYSWEQFVKDKRTNWSGVRNFQAAANLKAMKVGDRAFFYHSNEGLAVVGIAEIVKTAYPDPGDKTGKFVQVDIVPVMPVKESRLSVSPIGAEEWKTICKMAGVKP
jgi:predicted RNA-binding protein with PUA-like domain